MLPDWMKENDNYQAPKGGNPFALKTMQGIGRAMSRIQVQNGHEKKICLPALVKLLLLLVLLILVSVTNHPLLLGLVAAGALGYLATWPAKDLPIILRAPAVAVGLALVMFLPAFLMNPSGRTNLIFLICKVFLSVILLNIFNHTTQWNHITQALAKLHVPGIFIFTLDIALKYIVLLGKLIYDLLTSYELRSVGMKEKKYASIGGVMGQTFLWGAEMSREMYDAMKCRCFSDEYK